VRARDLWRVEPAHLQEAQDDAVLVAIRWLASPRPASPLRE